MEAYNNCQSCGMPLSGQEILGTEKDGSNSLVYCKHCYRNGEFTNPNMTLDEMKRHIHDTMKEMKMDEGEITKAVDNLQYLSRWVGSVPHASH